MTPTKTSKTSFESCSRYEKSYLLYSNNCNNPVIIGKNKQLEFLFIFRKMFQIIKFNTFIIISKKVFLRLVYFINSIRYIKLLN